jgi:hypothetical protein
VNYGRCRRRSVTNPDTSDKMVSVPSYVSLLCRSSQHQAPDSPGPGPLRGRNRPRQDDDAGSAANPRRQRKEIALRAQSRVRFSARGKTLSLAESRRRREERSLQEKDSYPQISRIARIPIRFIGTTDLSCVALAKQDFADSHRSHVGAGLAPPVVGAGLRACPR